VKPAINNKILGAVAGRGKVQVSNRAVRDGDSLEGFTVEKRSEFAIEGARDTHFW